MSENQNPGTSPHKLSRGASIAIKLVIAAAVLFAMFIAPKIRPETAADESPEGYPISRDVYLLDTYCTFTIYDGGGEEAMDAAVSALNEYDDLLNKSKEDSDISRINNRTEDTVKIDPRTVRMLETAREISEESGGALEPTIKPVTDLWDFKEKKTAPEKLLVDQALENVKPMMWELGTDSFTALDECVRIDIGAVAKGFVADEIKTVMKEHGVTSAVINLGGNVLCIGARPSGDPFRIAIKEPEKPENEYDQILEINDESAVTAGIYERCFDEDGIHYHHILDPQTGFPVQNGLESVTVTGPCSEVCDGLCTAIFVLGEEKGSEFLKEYNQSHGTDYRVYFLEKDGES